MNQKLHTARSGIVILCAILCIVCLSLSFIAFSNIAAYAEETTDVSAKLPANDGENDLWQIHYTDNEGAAVVESLWDGIHNGTPINYLAYVDGAEGSYIAVCQGTDEQLNYFTPYRGVELTIALNPDYTVGGKTLTELYDLDKAVYDIQTVVGGSDASTRIVTNVTVPSLTEGGKALEQEKEWMIATLCNTVDASSNYISDRGFAMSSNVEEVKPEMGSCIVYDFIDEYGNSDPIAIEYGSGVTYRHAIPLANGNYEVVAESSWEVDSELVNNDGGFINYFIRRLNVGNYTLKITALSIGDENDSDIYYAASSVSYDFAVVAQSISDDTFLSVFGSIPVIRPNSVSYTGDESWMPTISLNINGIELTQGVDFNLVADSVNVGLVDLRIVGQGNLSGEYVIKNAVEILPASNDWATLPNINAWSYRDYNKEVNKIVGMPLYPNVLTAENINDITFRIVLVENYGKANEKVVAIEGLEDIHYEIVEKNGETQYLVSETVEAILAGLHAGNYRMIPSVRGNGSTVNGEVITRNYQAIEERSGIDFEIRVGSNSWGENSVPTIVSWTAGKYDPKVNVISAIDRFDNEALVIIRNGENEIVYSNHPEHAGQSFGVYGKDADEVNKILKSLKAGYYTLRAEVKGTSDYNELNTLIDFVIARNGLPTWAVVLIVIGALGVVALVFGILHQKGVLQMLTGKVIVSMRTRANVDATLAAIRAAKVAREAEASIAAAKAREAEEEAKAKKDEK